jgi:hypothetical protein
MRNADVARWARGDWLLGHLDDSALGRPVINWQDGTSSDLKSAKFRIVRLHLEPLFKWYLIDNPLGVNPWGSDPVKVLLKALSTFTEPVTWATWKSKIVELKIPAASVEQAWKQERPRLVAEGLVVEVPKPMRFRSRETQSAQSRINPRPQTQETGKTVQADKPKSGTKSGKDIQDAGALTADEQIESWLINKGSFPTDLTSAELTRRQSYFIKLASDDQKLDAKMRAQIVAQALDAESQNSWIRQTSKSETVRETLVSVVTLQRKDQVKRLLDDLEVISIKPFNLAGILQGLSELTPKFAAEAGFYSFLERPECTKILKELLSDPKALQALVEIASKSPTTQICLWLLKEVLDERFPSRQLVEPFVEGLDVAFWEFALGNPDVSRLAIKKKARDEVVVPALRQALSTATLRQDFASALRLPADVIADVQTELAELFQRVRGSDSLLQSLMSDGRLMDTLKEVEKELDESKNRIRKLESELDAEARSVKEAMASLEKLNRELAETRGTSVNALARELEQAQISIARKWVEHLMFIFRELSRLSDDVALGFYESIRERAAILGVHVIGFPGEEVDVDPVLHELIGVSPNGRGIVSDPGYRWQMGDEEVLLSRALVRPTD